MVVTGFVRTENFNSDACQVRAYLASSHTTTQRYRVSSHVRAKSAKETSQQAFVQHCDFLYLSLLLLSFAEMLNQRFNYGNEEVEAPPSDYESHDEDVDFENSNGNDELLLKRRKLNEDERVQRW